MQSPETLWPPCPQRCRHTPDAHGGEGALRALQAVAQLLKTGVVEEIRGRGEVSGVKPHV